MHTSHHLQIVQALCLAGLFAVSGCSTESAKQNAYDAMQNYNLLQCQKNPTADCPKGVSYDTYQKQLKAENPPAQ
jgi:hypothetical protein